MTDRARKYARLLTLGLLILGPVPFVWWGFQPMGPEFAAVFAVFLPMALMLTLEWWDPFR